MNLKPQTLRSKVTHEVFKNYIVSGGNSLEEQWDQGTE